MSTSSDDEPNLAQLFGRQSQHTRDRSEDSDLPDWIKTNTPVKQIEISSDHEDSELDTRPSSSAAGAGTSNAAAADAQQPDGEQATAATPSKQAAAGKASSSAAVPTIAAAAATDRSELQLILPEKLIRNKALIELEPAPHQATELSGDAGAVGRLVASAATAEDGQFKIDLKGVLYQATVLPLAGTAFVVNLGPTEAKVEAVLNDFVRLKEESSYHDMGMSVEGGYSVEELMAADDDRYETAGEDIKDNTDKPAAKKAAATKRSKPASTKTAGSRSLKPAKAGVKKKPAKSKSSSKATTKPKVAPKPKAAPKSAAKPKSSTKKKKKDSDDEDDWDDSDYTE